MTQTLEHVAYYPRKQLSVVWGAAGTAGDLDIGVNDVGISVAPEPVRTTGGTLNCKHIIFQQGNLLARYLLR